MISWHRLFGLFLTDFFDGSPFDVELEKDLSLQQQLLDVIVVRKKPGEVEKRLPDGFEDMADHNLITFKSHAQSLDPWSIEELIGHYVTYRKLISPADKLRPSGSFRLFAVSARFPAGLSRKVRLIKQQPGVYETDTGLKPVRIVVASRLPKAEHNAILHLFSGNPDVVEFGADHFEHTQPNVSGLVNELFEHYELEGVNMPYTMEYFQRDYVRSRLDRLTPQERLEGLAQEERVAGLAPEDRVAGMSPEQLERLVEFLKQRRRESAQEPTPDDPDTAD